MPLTIYDGTEPRTRTILKGPVKVEIPGWEDCEHWYPKDVRLELEGYSRDPGHKTHYRWVAHVIWEKREKVDDGQK